MLLLLTKPLCCKLTQPAHEAAEGGCHDWRARPQREAGGGVCVACRCVEEDVCSAPRALVSYCYDML
jgi:hypothetical protein